MCRAPPGSRQHHPCLACSKYRVIAKEEHFCIYKKAYEAGKTLRLSPCPALPENLSPAPSTQVGLLRAATESSLSLNHSHGNQGSPQAVTLEGWDSILQSTCDPGEPIRLNWGTRLGVEISLTAVLWDQAAAAAITGKVLEMQILLEVGSWIILSPSHPHGCYLQSEILCPTGQPIQELSPLSLPLRLLHYEFCETPKYIPNKSNQFLLKIAQIGFYNLPPRES